MSIKIQIEDTYFLIQNKRYLGALTILMLAVAASSRKTFPKPDTRSFKNPNESMRDNEAFKVFLSRGFRRLMFSTFAEHNSEDMGISVQFRGTELDLAEILYKYYRCELVHQGELPTDVVFAAPPDGESSTRLVISQDEKSFVLDYNLLNILGAIVINAKCNGALFGINHNTLVPTSSEDEKAILNRIVNKWALTPGRYNVLKECVRIITPECILIASNDEVKEHFAKLVSSGVINGGAIVGLSSHELTSENGELQQKGLDIIREIAKSFTSA